MSKELVQMREYVKTLDINKDTISENEVVAEDDNIIDEKSKITFDCHQQIREFFLEIREFDDTTDVEAFSTQCRQVYKQMKTDDERIVLINKINAQKLKSEAIAVAVRLIEISP